MITLLLLFACLDAEEACVAPTAEDCRAVEELICNACSGYADACMSRGEEGTIAIVATGYRCECVTDEGGLKTTPECEGFDVL